MAGNVGRAVEGHVPRKKSGTPRMPLLLTTAQNVMSLARAENGAPAVRSDVHIEYTHRTVVATVTMVAGGRRKGGGGKPPEAVIGVVAGSNLYPGNLYIKFVFHSPPPPGRARGPIPCPNHIPSRPYCLQSIITSFGVTSWLYAALQGSTVGWQKCATE